MAASWGTWSSLSPAGGGEAQEGGWRPFSGRTEPVHRKNRKCGCITRKRQPPCRGGRPQTPGYCCHPPGSVSAPLGHPCPSPATGCHSRAQCSHRIKPLGVCHPRPLRDGWTLQEKPSQARPAGGAWPGLAGQSPRPGSECGALPWPPGARFMMTHLWFPGRLLYLAPVF